MKLLYYNDLNTKGLKQKVKKVEQMLLKDDFKSAEVKKMQPSNYYRAKLDRDNRLLFQFANYQGETYILLLEVIANHDYEKSKFLRGAEVKENYFTPVPSSEKIKEEELSTLRYINPKTNSFHLLDKVISLDDDQQEIYNLPAPLIIIGSAGSGKTALTLEKMKTYHGNVAYVSLSSYLVENSQKIYYANEYENEKQEIDFLSFQDYVESIQIPKGRPLDYRTFERWYERRFKQRFKFKDPYKIFEEFKGVLTGSVTNAAYLTRERYLKLGVKQSIFLSNEREKVYDLFEKYLDWLKEGDFYDPNMLSYNYLEQVEPIYDFLVIDEVQDITNIQLLLILKSLKTPTNFILSGDSNQIVHPNFFSWSKIKSLFFNQDLQGSALRILKTNYRNSKSVTQLSNDLLKVKNARFGSIDKESTYLISTVAEEKGEIDFFEASDKIQKDLNKRTENSAKFAVLVMDKAQKRKVSQYFKTPLIFTIQEAKGLEYENIILVNFISDYEKEFREISSGVSNEDLLDENMRFSRAKDKANKEQEAYKFYINSLYVAFTRAVKNLYIVETTKKHDLLKLLGIVETKAKVNIEQQVSNEQEWEEEAKRLEQQGKVEQAAAIRARLKGIEFISTEDAELLVEKVFGAEGDYTAKDIQKLFNFARSRYRTQLMMRLRDEAKYGPAKQYLGEYAKAQKNYLSQVRNGNTKSVQRIIERFGADIREDKEGMTGLMIACLYGKENMIQFFLAKGVNLGKQDLLNRTALQQLILGYDRQNLTLSFLKRWYPKIAPASGQCRYDGKLYFISRKSMEFFLVNFLNAIRLDVFPHDEVLTKRGLFMDDFMEFIKEMPESILPDYRRKRQYVNSVLSKHEVDRDDRYNRKLFIRRSRGCYDILPKAKISWG
ncbi:MAG: ankyrin repeat domain-containing protein [Bacteroidota bacterium]